MQEPSFFHDVLEMYGNKGAMHTQESYEISLSMIKFLATGKIEWDLTTGKN